MSFFNFARTFTLSSESVQGASVVGVSSVDLFFMYRPLYDAGSNISGTDYPGISLFIGDAAYEKPLVTRETFARVGRAEWNAIRTSSDGTVLTKFKFPNPIQLQTDREYSFLVSYDGNDQFMPWHNRQGYLLIDSGKISPGPSEQSSGSYYEYVGTGSLDELENAISSQELNAFWSKLTNVDLKFRINVARYSTNSYPIFANTEINPTVAVAGTNLRVEYDTGLGKTGMFFPSSKYECVSFDRASSTKQTFVGGQKAYQKTVMYPGGNSVATLSVNGSNVVSASATTSNGESFSFNAAFNNYAGDKYVTIYSGTDDVAVRRVTSIVSNTRVQVDEDIPFTNSAATFMLTPVGTIDSFNSIGTNSSFVFLRDSSANSSVRFVSHSVDFENVSVSNGGSGYSNGDLVYFLGYERVANKIPAFPNESYGNHPAVARLVTNSSGGVTSLEFSNVGAGFVNSSAITLAVLSAANSNPTTNTSAGTGLALDYSVGSVIETELSNNVFKKCVVTDLDMQYVDPFFPIGTPSEIDYSMYVKTQYQITSDATVSSGVLARVAEPVANNSLLVTSDGINRFANTAVPCLVSRSNEFVTLYANGAPNDLVNASAAFSNVIVTEIVLESNNDYVSPHVSAIPSLEIGKYVINDDFTGETTSHGNNLSRHVTNMINFSQANGSVRLAEDARLFVTAHRPPSSTIKAYARVQNSADPQAFDDCDWTELDLIAGGDSYSSPTSIDSLVQLTYGFKKTPTASAALSGVLSTTNASAVITGSNTSFSTEVSVGNLIRIYDPLFSNDNQLTALVTAVTNNTSLTIDQELVTTVGGFGGPELASVSGLKGEVITTMSHQAFANPQNDGIVRYYNLSDAVYDGYDLVQIKLALGTSDFLSIPRIRNVYGLGVSA